MSGQPTETEIQTQWKNAVDILEKTRVHADGLAAAAGELDVLTQSLEGEFTPAGLQNAAERYRAGLSSLVEPGRVLEFLEPVLFEYGGIITEGSGYADTAKLMRALYEHFNTNTLTVKNRAITYDTTATLGAGNVGNGTMSRLTVDENGHNLEACHVETKRWRCRGDQNSGTLEHAESFEVLGDNASFDSLLRSTFGSGQEANSFFRSRHAGAGPGGSLLRNSSFSTFSATATPKFVGWAETLGGAAAAADITQDTTNFFRSHPGASSDASLKLAMDAAGDTITLKQPVADMTVKQLDPDRPYFLRVMVNKTVGTAVGGSINIRMGSQSATSTVAALGAGWQEMTIAFTSACWFRTFNQDPLDIEIEWTGGTSGFMLFDDVLFTPWDLVDGTYWLLRGSTTPWLVDDTLAFTDTGGAPATGKVQWWLFVAGLGYLPSSAIPSFADP